MPEVEEGNFSTEGSVHLDALRGLAAMIVVLGHTRSLYFNSTATPFKSVESSPDGSRTPAAQQSGGTYIAQPSTALPVSLEKITFGRESVMIFFVLSGFLVGGSVLRSLRKNSWSWADYLSKRLTRLWVVLVPALLAGLAIDRAGIRLFGAQGIYGSPPGQLIVVGDLFSRLGLSTLLGNLFFTQGILVQTFGVNESLWSLAYEFWYYILFPLLGLALLSRINIPLRVLAVGGFAIIGYFVGTFIMMLFPVWMLGAAVAWLPPKFSERNARFAATGLAGLVILFMPLLRKAPISIYSAEWVIALLSAGLIYAIKHLNGRRKTDWYSAMAGFLSKISYTLYLVHLPIAVFLCAVLNRPWHIWPRTGANLSIWMATNIVVLLFAYVFYWLFESNTDSVRKAIMGRSKRQRIGT